MKTLFDETTIGPMTLKNRIWRSATWMKMADDEGHITEKLEKIFVNLATGGVGTIISGYAHVMKEEQPNAGMLGIYDDCFIPEYQQLMKKIKAEKANFILQIVYGGSFTNYKTENRTIWGPSAVPHPLTQTVPVEMTVENIKTLAKAFADAVERAKKAGIDGVQIHAAHTYLFSQFLSPYYNRRTDQYGGSIENRGRIIRETIAAIRLRVGMDYPVFVKMHCSDEWDDLGLTESESLYVAKQLEELGISGIEFSGGNLDIKRDKNAGPSRRKILEPEKQSYFAETTARIAEQLSVPVISVGGHRNPEKMTEILNKSNISYFAMARTLLAEPDLVNRWQSDNLKEPPCVACNKCFGREVNTCMFRIAANE